MCRRTVGLAGIRAYRNSRAARKAVGAIQSATALVGSAGRHMLSPLLATADAAAKEDKGRVLLFSERDGSRSVAVEAIAAAFAGAKFDSRLSEVILQKMWEKWVFIATGAAELPAALFDECASFAGRQGFPPRPEFLDRTRRVFTASGLPLNAPLLRDIERDAPIEADQLLGNLLRRADAEGSCPAPLLFVALPTCRPTRPNRRKSRPRRYERHRHGGHNIHNCADKPGWKSMAVTADTKADERIMTFRKAYEEVLVRAVIVLLLLDSATGLAKAMLPPH